jgi:hypothetical protein
MSSANNITRPTLQSQSAGTPAASALTNQNAGNQSHAKLMAAVGGKKRKKRLHHRGGAVQVSTIKPSYTPTGGQTQSPEYLMTQNAGNQSQGGENSKYDKLLGGGYMKWGCSSGGQRKRKSCRFNHNHSTHHHGKTTRKHKHSRHHRCNTKRKRY